MGSAGDVDWSEPILGWLLVTARRVGFDRFRRLARALRLRPATPASLGVDPATIDAFVDLRAQLAGLTAAERAAILLSAVEGWSPDEIGAALGISAGAVRAAASRGRAKLRVRLDERPPGSARSDRGVAGRLAPRGGRRLSTRSSGPGTVAAGHLGRRPGGRRRPRRRRACAARSRQRTPAGPVFASAEDANFRLTLTTPRGDVRHERRHPNRSRP